MAGRIGTGAGRAPLIVGVAGAANRLVHRPNPRASGALNEEFKAPKAKLPF